MTIHTLLSFIEFLLYSNLSVPTVKNYITSVTSFFKSNSISVEVFASHHLTMALSSLNKNYSPPISLKLIFSPYKFLHLIISTSQLPLHIFYKLAFILVFLCLLRISNIASTSRATFDPIRHLRRGDVTVAGDSIIIHLRWTKTLQRYRQSARIRLFSISNSPVCPLKAFLCNVRIQSAPRTPFFLTGVIGICVRCPVCSYPSSQDMGLRFALGLY
jgi:hypothetical protein